MSLLANLTTDNSIADEKDSVGSSFGPIDSGLYACKVALAYLEKSKGGALALNLTLKTEAGQEVRQQLWMTGGDAKGNKNYYEKDGERHYLPGFIHANALALLTCGKEISQLDVERKVIKLYNSEVKTEVPTPVEMVMDLLDKDILVGIIRQTVDKNIKDASGAYVPSGETRDENEIDKFFRARDRMTTAEIRGQATEATFVETWNAKWTGNTRNKAKGTKGNGTAGAPKLATVNGAAAGAGKPTSSLFS